MLPIPDIASPPLGLVWPVAAPADPPAALLPKPTRRRNASAVGLLASHRPRRSSVSLRANVLSEYSGAGGYDQACREDSVFEAQIASCVVSQGKRVCDDGSLG